MAREPQDKAAPSKTDERELIRDLAALLDESNLTEIEVERSGLHVRIAPPDTTVGRDILESVRRGDIDGMSFTFGVVRPGGERFEPRDSGLVRVVSDMRIAEVSLVTFPAYTATDASVAVPWWPAMAASTKPISPVARCPATSGAARTAVARASVAKPCPHQSCAIQ